VVSLTGVFTVFIVFFALAGALRGWAKEVLVAISVILALFLLDIFVRFQPPIGQALKSLPASERFIIQSLILIVLVVFGYAGPTLSGAVRGKLAREKLQDILLGAVIGGFNGYLIIGTIWYFMDQAHYPVPTFATAPKDAASMALIGSLPPTWLAFPLLYYALGLAVVVIIILWV
jgi:uncharacterized membrane protein required for colicin V production